MTDHFRLLAQPRQPWLDIEALKTRFLTLSGEVHPDRFHNAPAAERAAAAERYLAINTAHQCLRETKPRLQHLLELELGAKPAQLQQILPETMDLFLEVGQLCREVDAFLAAKSQTTSPMLKVKSFAAGLDWLDRVNALQQKINPRRAALETELQSLNPAWQTAPPPESAAARRAALPLRRVEEIYRLFSYYDRWSAQLQERAVQLSM